MTSTGSGTRFAAPSRRIPNLAAHVGGLALLFVAVGIGVSAAVEAGAGGEEVGSLTLSCGIVAAAGALLRVTTRVPERTSATSTFVAVGATWVLAAIGGAVPYVLADIFPTIDDALFESISGFTGTGSTVLAPIEAAPRGILFWRSMTQFYGGTGIVVLAVAILPLLGIGGMDLLRAEAPGPDADRLTPRVSETAKRLWFVYGGFTIIAITALLLVGLSPFDAVTHAFTTVSTGGLSPYDNSVAAFDSVAVELVLVVLMLYGATNFTLHWRFITGDRGAYRHSTMFRFFLGVFVSFTAGVTLLLWWQDDIGVGQALRDAVFNVSTLISSTGFGTADYTQWNTAAQLLLLAVMVGGGMAGSTAGGMKLIRVRVLFRFAAREIARVRHPKAVLPVKLGTEVIPERIVARMVGFGLFFVLILLGGTLVLAMLGEGFAESVGASVSSMSNMGPALGEAGPASNFLVFSRPSRAVLMVMMLAGRLEIFPMVFLVVILIRRTGRLRTGAVDAAGRRVDSTPLGRRGTG